MGDLKKTTVQEIKNVTMTAIEEKTNSLDNTLNETKKVLEEYYARLAEENDGDSEKNKEFRDFLSGVAVSLKNASVNLRKAYMRAFEMADELETRIREVEKSKKKRIGISAPPANSVIDFKEEENNNFARGINVYKLFLICFIGSFAGVVIELLWCFVTNGYIESRSGMVYGPFNLLYGFGAVMITLFLYKFRNRGSWLSFLMGMLVGSGVEYFCSFFQELVFGSRSWDYSSMPFNLNGRICLLYSIFWGFLGVLWIKNIYPRMAKLILKIPNRIGKIATWILTVFLIFDALVSGIAVLRWSQRVKGIEPQSKIFEIMDERFPDERMEKIYANMEFSK